MYNGKEIQQYEKIKYLKCVLDQSLSGESIDLNVIDKVNSRPKFLYRQNLFLTPPLCRPLCNALIQLLFDYACTAWFSNLSKRFNITSSSVTKHVHQVLHAVR